MSVFGFQVLLNCTANCGSAIIGCGPLTAVCAVEVVYLSCGLNEEVVADVALHVRWVLMCPHMLNL